MTECCSRELTFGPGGPTRPAAPGKPVAPWKRKIKLDRAKNTGTKKMVATCATVRLKKKNKKKNYKWTENDLKRSTYRRSLSTTSTFRSRNTCRTLQQNRYCALPSDIYFVSYRWQYKLIKNTLSSSEMWFVCLSQFFFCRTSHTPSQGQLSFRPNISSTPKI